MYQKWVFSIIKFILLTYVSLIVIVNLIIDPYQEYDFFKFDFNRYKFSTSYETIPFKLSQKLKDDRYTVVFGTSRSQLISKNIANENIINFSSSLYGNPIDVYNVINQFDKTQLNNIKEIWYLIDTHTFNTKSSIYQNLNIDSKKDFLLQTISNLNIHKIELAYETINSNLKQNYSYYLTEYGENIKIKEDNYFNGIITSDQKARIPITTTKAIEYLDRVDKFCKQNSIKIKYFTPIYNIPYLKKCDLNLYKDQFKEFLKVIDSFYDFHYIKNISNDLTLFSNLDHVNTKGTKYLIDLLKNNSSDYLITNSNLDNHIEKIFEDINNFKDK